jgi:hypothetical protein
MFACFRGGTQGQMHVHSTPVLNTTRKHWTRVDVFNAQTYNTAIVFIIHQYWTRLELDEALNIEVLIANKNRNGLY